MKTEQIGGAMFLPPIFLPFTGPERQHREQETLRGGRPCVRCSGAAKLQLYAAPD